MDTLKSHSQDVNFEAINGGTDKWTDSSWPTSDALFWYDQNENEGDFADVASISSEIEWKRAAELQTEGFSFWGPDGMSSIRPGDIN